MTRFITKAMAITAFTCIATSTSLHAHESCNVQLNSGININKTRLEFLDENHKSLYKIVNNQKLIINGASIDLTAKQQSLVTHYSTSIRAIIPQVRTVAIEGIDIAIDGVNLAFKQLLGPENSLSEELTNELVAIREEVNNETSIEHGFTIGANGSDDEALLTGDLEQRIGSVIEQAMLESIGTLLVTIGQEMLFSNDNADSLEDRMADFDKKLESHIEAKAEKLTNKTHQLCLAAIKIEQLEEQLKENISQLAHTDFISTNFIENNNPIDNTTQNSNQSM